MELAVFVGRAAELAHDFRTHGALRRNHETNVVFQSFLKKKAAGLAIFFGEIGKLLIEVRIHLQTDLFRKCLGHVVPLPIRFYVRGVHKSRAF
jgi:hypothetical protein